MKFGIILGSGLGGFVDHFTILERIPFASVLDVVYDPLDGHERCFYKAKFQTHEFLIISGRFHFYEGFTLEEIAAPIKFAIEAFNIKAFVVTSVSGGLSKRVSVGEWTNVESIIGVPGINIHLLESKISNNLLKFSGSKTKSVYAFQSGPSLGTPAEYKMLSNLRADLVGMSMLPEKIILTNIPSIYLSLPVCIYFPFIDIMEPGHNEVIRISKKGIIELSEIFVKILKLE